MPDVLVNNAGIGHSGTFLQTTEKEWQRVLDVNLWGVIHGCRAFGALMVERGRGGHIVNLASAAAYLPSKVLAAYATSKAAVLMLSDCLRAELADERDRGERDLPRHRQHQHHQDLDLLRGLGERAGRQAGPGGQALRPPGLPAGEGGRRDRQGGAHRQAGGPGHGGGEGRALGRADLTRTAAPGRADQRGLTDPGTAWARPGWAVVGGAVMVVGGGGRADSPAHHRPAPLASG